MRRVICLTILLLSCIAHVSHSEPSDPLISLAGNHKFHPGDNPQWSDPSYDDSHWQTIKVPASWQSQGVRPEKGMGWYRIHISIPERYKDKDLGISLGFVGNADEAFLNGVKIGSVGTIGPRFIEAPRINRLYRIPRNHFQFANRNNVLSVRVMHIYGQGGIFDGNPALGYYGGLLAEKLKKSFTKNLINIFTLAVLLIFIISGLFFYLNGIRDREYIYFGLFALATLFAYTFDSPLFYDLDLKTSFIQSSIGALVALIPLFFLLFLTHALGFELNCLLKTVILYSVLLSVGILFLVTYSYAAYNFLSALWSVEIILTGIAGIYISVWAYKRRYHESGPILLGVWGLLCMALLETLYMLDTIQIDESVVVDFPLLFSMGCMLYALTMRFVRFRDRTRTLSGKILVAHEEERKRLARELHDGLGQNLLALKFNLQRIHQNPNTELMDGAIKDVSESIDELRQISRGLRPAFLDEMGLAAAMRSFGRSYSNKTGINVHLTTDPELRCAATIEDNLFRVFQEALSNAARHGGAEDVKVTLTNDGKRIFMSISDDGRGFDSHPAIESLGIGLSTIEERVALLDGRLLINTQKGKGTEIRVEVPLK